MTHRRRSYQRHAFVSRPNKGVCFWHVLIIPDQLARSSLGFQLGKAPMLWFTARIWNFPWRAPRSNPGPVMLTWMPLRLSKEMQTIEMMDMTFMWTSFKDIYIDTFISTFPIFSEWETWETASSKAVIVCLSHSLLLLVLICVLLLGVCWWWWASRNFLEIHVVHILPRGLWPNSNMDFANSSLLDVDNLSSRIIVFAVVESSGSIQQVRWSNTFGSWATWQIKGKGNGSFAWREVFPAQVFGYGITGIIIVIVCDICGSTNLC